MPSIDDVFGGTTLKSVDIQGKNPVVTISAVTPKEFKERDGQIKTKLMIAFIGAKKALVCNSTNAQSIARIYGKDYSSWVGQKIRLGTHMTPMGMGICVLDPNDKIETGRPPLREEIGDDVPF